MQSQWESFMETVLNAASGFAISWLMTTWVFPVMHQECTKKQKRVTA